MSERGRDFYSRVTTRQGVPEDRIDPLFSGEPREFLEESIPIYPANLAIDGMLREVACRVVYSLRPLSWYVARRHYGHIPVDSRNPRMDTTTGHSLDRFARLHLPQTIWTGVLNSLRVEVLDPDELSDTLLKYLRPGGNKIVTVEDSEIIFRTTAGLVTNRGKLQSICNHALSIVWTNSHTWPQAVKGGDDALSLRYIGRSSRIDSQPPDKIIDKGDEPNPNTSRYWEGFEA